MKSYTQPELRTFVSERLSPLEGARLQEVLSNDRGLALGFWKNGLSWLILDLPPNDPIALLYKNECPFRKAAKGKPVGLFLKSHGVDKVLKRAFVREEFGRVLSLELADAEGGTCEVEVQLIPKQSNLIVRAGGKQVAWEKPKELSPQEPRTDFPPSRDLETIHQDWKAPRGAPSSGSALDPRAQWEKKRERDLEKKRKALDGLDQQVSTQEDRDWAARGEALKIGSGEMIDASKPRSWNIEEAFARAKKFAAKKEGALQRKEILLKEIEALEKESFEDFSRRTAPRTGAAPALMAKSQARGRTLHLGGDLSAFVGKSAADNMALLRKARAWDYWLHLRDEPGAYAIIQRPKQRMLSDQELREVARWLIKESVKKPPMAGEKIPVVVTECRHVRPIKGDKLGRVTYHEARHFDLRWE